MAFSSNLFGSITHRGGRDARVPVRYRFAANVSAAPMCGRFRISNRFTSLLVEGKPSSLTRLVWCCFVGVGLIG
ncbi:MAG: hypothetical protein LBQ66_14255 [Planctomycetaceae bacterium]|nr:hypothetical protein [Planctomycetaceae bacterium]